MFPCWSLLLQHCPNLEVFSLRTPLPLDYRLIDVDSDDEENILKDVDEDGWPLHDKKGPFLYSRDFVEKWVSLNSNIKCVYIFHGLDENSCTEGSDCRLYTRKLYKSGTMVWKHQAIGLPNK